MNIIKKNNWFVRDNNLLISLNNFYAGIYVLSENDNVYFKVSVLNYNTMAIELELLFSTMEESISFIEDVVDKCSTFDEILLEYKNLYDNENKILKKGK